MLPGGIPAIRSNSAFGEMLRNGDMVRLPFRSFKEVESRIGKEVLKAEEESIVVIWVDELPIKIIYLNYGEIIETEVIKKGWNLNPWQLIEKAEEQDIKVFDVDY
ncbi:hypothetical protein J8N01_25995 [Priestia megaterium]|uniref:hypothetical protein n=1 Tax=Priestia megaterium TaxID=1404 RepID=UPI002379453C|nr:hypothetical protein [Priestia megaterium]WDM33693.1 hypothetical protein J8N01_25995 [Priestia megaterium]